MMLLTRLSALALLTLALSACGEKDAGGPERKTAAGEVLGGSVSDAMLPLDTVQSQSPPLHEGAADVGHDAEDVVHDAEDEANADADAAPSGAAEPTPEASASLTRD